MKSKWILALLLAVVGAAAYGGTVLATPPSGVLTTIIAVGRFDANIDARSKTALPATTKPVAGKGEKGDDSDNRTKYWKAGSARRALQMSMCCRTRSRLAAPSAGTVTPARASSS
jgi:hypothetical protein